MKVKILSCLAGLLLLAVAGCGKPAGHSTTQPAAGAPPGAAPVAAGPDLKALTQLVRKYAAEHRAVPATAEELVRAGYLPALPSTPAGKKLAIDARSCSMILVSQ